MRLRYLWLILSLSILCPAQDFQGSWRGSVQEYGKSVRYLIHISKKDAGISATFDQPESFSFGNSFDSISLTSSELQFRVGLISYSGSLSADSSHIEGLWSVGAQTQQVTWIRDDNVAKSPIEEVATTLQSLMYLRADRWKIHPSDIPHGESMDLDDSSWEEVGPNTFAPDQAVWYRRWVEIPETLNGYDLTGSRIWFDFQYDANGPVTEIVYFNGRRVAMGDSLEPIVLFEHARPGEKTLVAVKLLRSVDRKHFYGVRLAIEFPSTRPNPERLFQELGAVSILAPTSIAPGKLQEELAKSAAAVDQSALVRSDQGTFDSSLTKARAVLQSVKPDLQQTSLRLSGNSHIDAAWLWPWTETVDVVRRTFGTALQLMDEYPELTYTQSAAAYNEWMFQKYPFLHEQIVNRVKEGRWELVGGMWVEPDLNMPDGESLVRQLLIGKRYFKEKFGTEVRIGWNPDSFGYNWQLPQIYKKSGIDYFVTQKMAWNDTNQLPLKVFWWQSPDGSRVLTYFPHDYGNDTEPLKMVRDIATSQSLNPGIPEMMHLFGVGDHGGGPTRAMVEEAEHWCDPKVIYPESHFGAAQGFFSDIESKADSVHSPVWNYKSLAGGAGSLPTASPGKFSLPVWNDELYFEYHRGVFTTQAQHKRNMRESEEEVLNAEKFSSLAWLSGNAYPAADLDEAWKKVLFNQFHDLAAGSGIAQIYRDAQLDYDFVRLATERIRSQAVHTLADRIDTRSPAGGASVLVFNPLAWDRTDLAIIDVQMPEPVKGSLSVVNSKGKPQSFQVLSHSPGANRYRLLTKVDDVPSIGYRILHIVPGDAQAPTDVTVHGLTLENSKLRIVIDEKTGCVTSLFDKSSQFETIAANGCGNELIAFKDTPKDYDAWNIDPDFDRQFTKLDMVDSVKVTERGPLRATVRIVRSWQSSKFVQEISLYSGLDRVDVQNEFDWHENHILLKAAFPLAASSNEATYEIPFGSIDRPTTRNNSFEDAKFEVPALRWADLGNGKHGFSLINESKYGYDGRGDVLRLSLLRSPTWPDPQADRGHHSFSYSLYPHPGDWKQALTVRRGYEFNYKLLTEQVQSHAGVLPPQNSFVSVGGDHVVLTALKKAVDSDALLVRIYEWAGKAGEVQLTVPQGVTGAQLTNLMEEPEGPPLPIHGEKVTVPVRPYEIISVRISYKIPSQEASPSAIRQ